MRKDRQSHMRRYVSVTSIRALTPKSVILGDAVTIILFQKTIIILIDISTSNLYYCNTAVLSLKKSLDRIKLMIPGCKMTPAIPIRSNRL